MTAVRFIFLQPIPDIFPFLLIQWFILPKRKLTVIPFFTIQAIIFNHLSYIPTYFISHPPHSNRPPTVFLLTVPDLITPAYAFVPVKDDEMPLAHITAAVHITYRLLQAFSDGLVQITTLDFQFQHNVLHGPP